MGVAPRIRTSHGPDSGRLLDICPIDALSPGHKKDRMRKACDQANELIRKNPRLRDGNVPALIQSSPVVLKTMTGMMNMRKSLEEIAPEPSDKPVITFNDNGLWMAAVGHGPFFMR